MKTSNQFDKYATGKLVLNSTRDKVLQFLSVECVARDYDDIYCEILFRSLNMESGNNPPTIKDFLSMIDSVRSSVAEDNAIIRR